ncbi:2,4-dihydroxyhept-2-ene-1,7-dioic acid aldolase [Cryptococcus deuterogattii R265]|uniref:2,4-dihydroxyhept-2-ene-1,7-dioic acid aldolase n=1 Tax=Cryptococcus deuterogattii (strain R265) TaxID=294750 RepID=A0A095EJV2_CRYD2|nr:2,4-dihydroxyhept-2-ene-1,7-dioic acid aldolase [Cryptococcus deuterogattii R265]KIR74918.1 2,4-dihydroxyhept-2-ene-1,7-dioic acid aldolase [Cryptococcus deuterogattii CA1014]
MESKTFLKNALAQKKPGVGFWSTLPGAATVATVLSTGGFNWTLIDAEHGMITDKDYFELVNTVTSHGASPIIRVPWNEEWMIKRALDAGAQGVMTPMCHSAEDAKRIVSYSKYPPVGTRGYGPMFCPPIFQCKGSDYDAGADKNLLVIVQIESRKGVENVEEIAKVEGLDCLFIGPFDLSKQMNVPFGGEEHEAAIEKTLKAAHNAHKIAAIFCSNGEVARKRLEQGFDMVSIAVDSACLAAEMERQLSLVTGEAGKGDRSYS